MVLPGESDITTVSTRDAANSRRCRSVTPQQGGKERHHRPGRKEVRGKKSGEAGRKKAKQ